eukprot:1517525-Rhodomonas_salina.1
MPRTAHEGAVQLPAPYNRSQYKQHSACYASTAQHRIRLSACYTVPDTDLARPAVPNRAACRCAVSGTAQGLDPTPALCFVSSTDLVSAYGPAMRCPVLEQAVVRQFAMRCPVLRSAMLLQFARRCPVLKQAMILRFARRCPVLRYDMLLPGPSARHRHTPHRVRHGL